MVMSVLKDLESEILDVRNVNLVVQSEKSGIIYGPLGFALRVCEYFVKSRGSNRVTPKRIPDIGSEFLFVHD